MALTIPKKPADEEEVDLPRDEDADEDDGEDDDDEDDDEDDGDEDDDDDEDDEDGESTPEKVAQLVTTALRDACESCDSATADKRRILLDLDDESRWLLTVKRRD